MKENKTFQGVRGSRRTVDSQTNFEIDNVSAWDLKRQNLPDVVQLYQKSENNGISRAPGRGREAGGQSKYQRDSRVPSDPNPSACPRQGGDKFSHGELILRRRVRRLAANYHQANPIRRSECTQECMVPYR